MVVVRSPSFKLNVLIKAIGVGWITLQVVLNLLHSYGGYSYIVTSIVTLKTLLSNNLTPSLSHFLLLSVITAFN